MAKGKKPGVPPRCPRCGGKVDITSLYAPTPHFIHGEDGYPSSLRAGDVCWPPGWRGGSEVGPAVETPCEASQGKGDTSPGLPLI